MSDCQLRYMFTKTTRTMDEERLDQENPGGTTSLARIMSSACQDQVKGEIQWKKIKASTTAGTQADSPLSTPDCSVPKNKRQKRLPHSSCCRTVTYDHKRGTFIARKPRKRWRRVERIKNMTQCAHSKSEQKKSTARKTTNPACPHDYMGTKSSETGQPKEMIDCTNLYELQGSSAQSDVLHKSKRMTVSPPSVVTHNKRQRRNCWLGSPRIPNGYPSFHSNKMVGKKTARASLRTGIPGKYVQKYSSMRLPHQGQKVPLKSCPVDQSPAGGKKDKSMKHDGENTVGRHGTHCDLSRHRPGESLLPQVSTVLDQSKRCSVRTGQKLETVVSKLWTRVGQEEPKSQINTADNTAETKAQNLQCDSLSGITGNGNIQKETNNSSQQDLSLQTTMDNPRKPADTGVDCVYRGTSRSQQEAGSLQRGICEEGLSLRLCRGSLETMEPTSSEMAEVQAFMEEPPKLEWMGDRCSPTCDNTCTAPPQLIPVNLSCNVLTVPNGSMSVDCNEIGTAEQTFSSLLRNNLPEISTSSQHVNSTSDHYRRGEEHVQNSELCSFPQDPYPDVDIVNGKYFMSFSNQESLEAHNNVEARIEREFRLDSRLFIQNVLDFKLYSGKRNKRRHRRPEGWNPGFHNRHTRYNMMLVEEVLKRRFLLSGRGTEVGMGRPSSVLPIHPTQTANGSQASCQPSCQAQGPFVAPPRKRRRGDDKIVSRFLGCEKLHWKKRARLMLDMVQAGNMVQAGPTVQAGTMVQAATVQAGTMEQAGTTVQTGTMIQAGTMVQAGTTVQAHTMAHADTVVQAGTTVQADTMVQADTTVQACTTVQAGTTVQAHTTVHADTVVQAGTTVQADTTIQADTTVQACTTVQAGTTVQADTTIQADNTVQAGTTLQAGITHDMSCSGVKEEGGKDTQAQFNTAQCHASKNSKQSLVWSSQYWKKPPKFKCSSLESHLRENDQKKQYGCHPRDQVPHMCNKNSLTCGQPDTSSRVIGEVQNKSEPSRSRGVCSAYRDKTAESDRFGTIYADVYISPVNSHSVGPTQVMSFPQVNCSDRVRDHLPVTCPDLVTPAGADMHLGPRNVLKTQKSAPESKQTEVNFATFESLRAPKQRPIKTQRKISATVELEKKRGDLMLHETVQHNTCSPVMENSSQTDGKKCISKHNSPQQQIQEDYCLSQDSGEQKPGNKV